MNKFKQYGYFSLVSLVRFVLWVAGFIGVAFSVAGKGFKHTPALWRWCARAEWDDYVDGTTRWDVYKYWAFRNPTPLLIGKFEQPVPETRPNPDHNVRVEGWPEDERWMESGIYWEYWKLRRIDWRIPNWVPWWGGKHYRWFEKRIGWKFVDGNDEFFPTFQFGPRSS